MSAKINTPPSYPNTDLSAGEPSDPALATGDAGLFIDGNGVGLTLTYQQSADSVVVQSVEGGTTNLSPGQALGDVPSIVWYNDGGSVRLRISTVGLEQATFEAEVVDFEAANPVTIAGERGRYRIDCVSPPTATRCEFRILLADSQTPAASVILLPRKKDVPPSSRAADDYAPGQGDQGGGRRRPR